ncbi:Mur ligase [Dactylonectria estremocensis]|uniref:Folylpolyglutamate synthase n=1 Tax=Dactylonectria estremocensis TaxID=1079267 RepID=A0A9P9JEV3_9HYPO|nr:Mur ligase [Dactylonectria estremocensis]
MASPGRSYNDAIDALNSLQTPFDIIEARRKAGIKPDAVSIKEMRTYLGRIGYTPLDLDRINIVHVAGTKGKGSTCAFVDSILAQYQRTLAVPRKTGLFTSPHLIAVRERIRINSKPISEDLFAKYFFEVWDRLEPSATAHDENALMAPRPIYARYLTLMSWHVFLQEGVDVAVYETGIGGEFDATNVVERPVASGISTLGIDHVFALGDTVGKIAWHKAGIMKTGSLAFTIEQVPEAAEVLRQRAVEKKVDLKALEIDARLGPVRIRPDAAFQKRNASLAVALAETVLRKLEVALPPKTDPLPQEFVDGLEKVVWRGRCEVKKEDEVIWHVDGAHTSDSLKMSAKWFNDATSYQPGPRIMIFNQQGRSEAVDFLESIQKATKRDGKPAFDHVVFCTNVTFSATGYKRDFVNRQFDPADIDKMTVQHRFAEKWLSIDPDAVVKVMPTIEQSIDYARQLGEGLPEGEAVQALITGSLHLVGGALGILEKADAL